jgi:hypothetical protein
MKPTAKHVLAMNDFQYMYRTTGLMSNGDQRMASLSTYKMQTTRM